MTLPPWPGPVTPESPHAEILDRQEHLYTERRAMPNPTGGEDWHSQDDPPPRKPEPKPTTPSK